MYGKIASSLLNFRSYAQRILLKNSLTDNFSPANTFLLAIPGCLNLKYRLHQSCLFFCKKKGQMNKNTTHPAKSFILTPYTVNRFGQLFTELNTKKKSCPKYLYLSETKWNCCEIHCYFWKNENK